MLRKIYLQHINT